MTPRPLVPAVYWRLRYLQRECEARELEARLALGAAQRAYHDALRAVGIDPATPYTWQDADTTLVPTRTATTGPDDAQT